MTEASPIPPPRSDDDEDVHWALSTASALWARGDTGEALKWLRRAAETASDQNRDQRSLELFKAAADATSLLGGRGSGSVPAPPGHGHVPPTASTPPPGASASHPPPRTSGTPPPPRAATAPPPRVSATPPPPRVSAAPPASSASTPPPLGSAAPPPRLSATPAPPQVGPAARPSALPSASTPRPPSAVPAPVAAARAVLKGKETPASQRPSGAVTRKRKNTLDERFQFPDEEVTQQRDMRSLDRSRPGVQPPAPPPDDAAVSAMAPTAPHPSRGGAPASRSSGTTATAARTGSAGGLRGSASNTPAGPLHATTTRTILSAGTSPRPSGVQPAGSAAASAAARAMSRQPTRKIDTTPPPVDDLDEQTSVLSGDEAELDFDGSATGENPVDDPRTVHDEPPDALPSDASASDARDATPEPTPGASATDEPLYAPSIRPQPLAEPAHTGATGSAGAAAWPTMRVALRREAGGVRIEALGIHATTPPGAVAALLVAHDPASAEALAKLLEPR